MKLLKVFRKEGIYFVEALQPIRFWNIKLGSKKVKFQNHGDVDHWTYAGKNKLIKGKRQRILRRWILDHQRFVE